MKTDLIRNQLSAADYKFAIVVSRWNNGLTTRLAKGAVDALTAQGAGDEAINTYYVPGAFELPLACLTAANSGDFDAVIALGVVIRGDTPHFDYVAGQAAAGLMQASMLTGVPVLFGVITANNQAQAEARCGQREENKGYEAALSALEMAHLLRSMR